MPRIVRNAILALAAAPLLAACSYDHLQRTDRVGYSAGNAVRANLEAQTTDPSKGTMYETDDLGQNGPVISSVTTTAP